MKLRLTRKRLFGIASLLILLIYIGYGVIEPQTSPGHAVFHAGYSLPVSRPLFLRFYRWSLREFNGGYLPSSIDGFLTSRLWECEGTAEWRAIIDFEISQGSGRWGEALSQTHDEMKRKIIGDIICRQDTFPPEQAVNALLLVESLRQGDPLHKGEFSNLDLWMHDGTKWVLRTEHLDRLALVKDAFRRWWNEGSAWPGNRSQDPLAGTGISIHRGP